MAGAWNSNGTNFTDLTEGGSNQRPYFEFLIVMSIAGIIWPIVSIVILFPFKQDMPPIVVSLYGNISPCPPPPIIEVRYMWCFHGIPQGPFYHMF